METIPLTEFSLLPGLSSGERDQVANIIAPATAAPPAPYSSLGLLYHTSKLEEICSLLQLDIQGTRRMTVDGELSFHFVTYSRRDEPAPIPSLPRLNYVGNPGYLLASIASSNYTPPVVIPTEITGVVETETTIAPAIALSIEPIEAPLESENSPAELAVPELTPIPAEPPSSGESYSVEVKSWDGSHGVRQWLIPHLETVIAPTLKMDVVVHVPHGISKSPSVDGKFHIHFYSAPTTRNDFSYPPNTLYSRKVSCSDCSGFGYNDTGIPIKNGTYILGEVFQDNAYVYFDAVHTMDEDTTYILQRILEDIVKVQFDPEIKEKELQCRKKKWADVLEKASLCSKEKYKNEINAFSDKIELLRGDMAATIKKVNMTRLMLEALENDKALVPAERQWDMLYKHPDIENITVGDNYVGVTTRAVYFIDPNNQRMYELGRLSITATPGSASANVKVVNLTRTVSGVNNGMHAPHVFSDGKVCFGNAEGAVVEMLASGHIAGIFILLLKFLQTVNPFDSAGAYLNRWPEVDPVTKRVLDTGERASDPYGKGFFNIESVVAPSTATDPVYNDPDEEAEEAEEAEEDEFVYEDDIEEED